MAADSEHPWLSNYPPEVARAAPPLGFANLGEMVHAVAARYGERPAATLVLPNGMEASLSFEEVDALSDQFAAYLRHCLHVAPGERVAILLPNCLAYPVCAFGVLKAGGVVVNTNPLYTPRELELQLKDSGARTLVVLDKFADKLSRVLPQTQVRSVIATGIADFFPFFERLLIGARLRLSGQIPRIAVPHCRLASALRQGMVYAAKERLLPEKDPVRIGPETLALLQYTGGTTGTSKGAMLSHGNLLANLAQLREVTHGYLKDGAETVLTALPLYHVFAFTTGLLFVFATGGHNLLVPNPRPIKNLKPVLRNHEVTWAPVVNTLLRGLLAERWFQKAPPSTLRAVYAGGTQTGPEVRERWEQLTRAIVIDGYGLSEASPVVTFTPARRAEGDRFERTLARCGGVGLPLPGTEVKLVGDDGAPVAPGECGELLVRGPQVMQGYWNQPEESARALRDGWLHTGDVARMDALGCVDITDRKKDMIIVSGFKVYPNEVEACIAQHPDVADVAVVGVPDDETGEAVRAFIVPKKTGELTTEAIRDHCRALLSGYKIPRSVRFLGEMPKTPLGKPLRRELRCNTATS